MALTHNLGAMKRRFWHSWWRGNSI